jgi:hypothetical protein
MHRTGNDVKWLHQSSPLRSSLPINIKAWEWEHMLNLQESLAANSCDILCGSALCGITGSMGKGLHPNEKSFPS